MLPKNEIIVKDNPTHLAQTAATIFSGTARTSVSEKERFVVAISGGSTPRTMHRMLAQEPYRSEIPWDKTHIFWVDDRCVPVNDRASNYGAVKKDLLERIPIPGEQIHPMPGEAPPEDGAIKYQGVLMNFFQLEEGQFPIFDLIFLGMGPDGHTASLFPGQRALNEKKRLVVAVKGGSPDVNRLTMTYPVLNRAGQIVFLVSGKGKCEILKTAFENREARLPAQKIRPINGGLIWLLDRDAASLLPGNREMS